MELYPPGFEPDHPEKVKGKNESFIVPGVNLVFKRWTGSPMVNDFNGKPAVEFEGKAMFAELAMVSMLKKAGWSARWVSVNYLTEGGPHYMTEWNDAKPFRQTSVPLSDECLKLMSSIKNYCANTRDKSVKRGNPYSGAWDIISWRGKRVLFMESKHAGNDHVKVNQVQWYSAAINCGLKRDDFLVVQWRFEDEPTSKWRTKALANRSAPITGVP